MMGEKDCKEREGVDKKVVEIGYLIEQRNFRDHILSLRTNSSNVKPYTRLKYCATIKCMSLS